MQIKKSNIILLDSKNNIQNLLRYIDEERKVIHSIHDFDYKHYLEDLETKVKSVQKAIGKQRLRQIMKDRKAFNEFEFLLTSGQHSFADESSL